MWNRVPAPRNPSRREEAVWWGEKGHRWVRAFWWLAPRHPEAVQEGQ